MRPYRSPLRKSGLLLALVLSSLPGCRSARQDPAEAPAAQARPKHSARAEEHPPHPGHHPHSGHQDRRFKDPADYVERWNNPERDLWQRPDRILSAMDLGAGDRVADIGAGTGYFTPHLSGAVGPLGRVYAVDIETSMLDYIQGQAQEHGWSNVETRLSEGDQSGLDPSSVDRILIVNTWHHIPSRRKYSRHLRERLRDGGSVWIVDFLLDSPDGPPKKHRLPPEVVVQELEAGGLRAEVHPQELERQYLVVGYRD